MQVATNQMTNLNINLNSSGQMQMYNHEQENLKTYITDLKKAAIGNKKSRGNAQT